MKQHFFLVLFLLAFVEAQAEEIFQPNGSDEWMKTQETIDIVQWSRHLSISGHLVRVDAVWGVGSPVAILVRGQCPNTAPREIWAVWNSAENEVGLGVDCYNRPLTDLHLQAWVKPLHPEIASAIKRLNR